MIGRYACAVIVAAGALGLSQPAAFAARQSPDKTQGSDVRNAPGGVPESARPEGPPEPPPTPASIQESGADSQQQPEKSKKPVRGTTGEKKSKKKKEKKKKYHSSVIIHRKYTSNVHVAGNGIDATPRTDPSGDDEGQGGRGQTGDPTADRLLAEFGG